MNDFFDIKDAKFMQSNLHRQLNKLPENQKDSALAASRIVDDALAEMDKGFTLESQLQNFLKQHGIRNLYPDEFLEYLKKDKHKIVRVHDKLFIAPVIGGIFEANDYIYTLEKAIMFKESPESLCTYITLKDIFKILMYKIKGVFSGKVKK